MTTIDRRLTKVESGLSPTALVLRWLAEAHAFDDLEAHTRSLVAAGPTEFPLDRLAQQAQSNARAQSRGQPRDQAEAAIRKAIVETVFRFQLVLRINVLAHDFLDREVLLQGVLSAHLGLALSDGKNHPPREPEISPIKIRDLLFARVTELHAMEAARETVEARYLDGVPALFPADQRAWANQRANSERMAVLAMRLVELDGIDELPADDPVAFEARVAQLVSDQVEPARSSAWDQLGDGQRALNLAVRWLRPKLGVAPTSW